MEEFIVYAIYNDKYKKIYIGQTSDINTRLKRHNGELLNKPKSFTALRKEQWQLVYTEKFNTRKDAIKREKELKSYQGRQFIKNIIKNKFERR